MKKIKVSIKDENTLVLLEAGNEGDIIDLNMLHDVDIDKTTIKYVVNSIKRDKLNEEVKKETEKIEKEHEYKLKFKEQELSEKAKQDLNQKNQEIALLQSELKNIAEKTESKERLKAIEDQKKIEQEYQESLRKKEEELSKIKHDKEFSEEKLRNELKASQNELVLHKEMRMKMSTKMIGESLEIHCENEFNKIRSIAFPNAEFGKDNDAS